MYECVCVCVECACSMCMCVYVCVCMCVCMHLGSCVRAIPCQNTDSHCRVDLLTEVHLDVTLVNDLHDTRELCGVSVCYDDELM